LSRNAECGRRRGLLVREVGASWDSGMYVRWAG
jgi:hypothetical protein